ncbi:FAS1-like dehydratase domain-containing protein [Dactylosporangium sp. CA-092794]|uniref:FAS1-like dehydratase domain-containing protein n=1 Tax=Dactylosporangium sp. CA-092794 TaxID=3239929 RepID=UPI003D907DC9
MTTPGTAAATTPADSELIRSFLGRSDDAAQVAPDPVNLPMIRRWCDALGDDNPIYTSVGAARAAGHPGIVAPPGMLHVWTTPGLRGRALAGVTAEVQNALNDAGYTGTVAVTLDNEYLRYLVLGDQLTCVRTIESISPEKRTGLGPGVFVTSRADYRDADGELVGTIRLTFLRFRPPGASVPPVGRPGGERA